MVDSASSGGDLVASARAETLGSTCTACRSTLRVQLRQLSRTPRPKIIGDAETGERLKVRPGKWDAGVTLRYRWFVGKKAVPGTTGKRFKVRQKYVGKRIRVKVTGTKPGYQPETVRSKRTPRVT